MHMPGGHPWGPSTESSVVWLGHLLGDLYYNFLWVFLLDQGRCFNLLWKVSVWLPAGQPRGSAFSCVCACLFGQCTCVLHSPTCPCARGPPLSSHSFPGSKSPKSARGVGASRDPAASEMNCTSSSLIWRLLSRLQRFWALVTVFCEARRYLLHCWWWLGFPKARKAQHRHPPVLLPPKFTAALSSPGLPIHPGVGGGGLTI